MMPLTHFLVAYLLTEPLVGPLAVLFASFAVAIDLDHILGYYLKFNSLDVKRVWAYSVGNYDWDVVGPLHSKWVVIGLPLFLLSNPYLQAFLLAYYSHIALDRIHYCCFRAGFLDRRFGPSWYRISENELLLLFGVTFYLIVAGTSKI